jgi:Protein of unknown function (DUF1524)
MLASSGEAAGGTMSGRGATLMAAVAVLLVGCVSSSSATPASTGSAGSSARTPTASTGPSGEPSASATSHSPSGSALAALATLPVKGRAPMTGYSRAQFGPAWEDVDHNGCDTRNDILRRDLVGITASPSCLVLRGTLHDPYTGKDVRFVRGPGTSSQVQIDHVVALGDAWQKGAQQLSADARVRLANDPLNLLAVDASSNQRKGDGDAATWLPPNKAYRCQYVARQVAVKTRYHLWATSAEKAAIARVLAGCPNQGLPTGGLTGPVSTAKPTAQSTTQTSHANLSLPVVHPGAFCSPPGARGVTTAGTPMVCKLDSKGVRYRWGHA